MKQAGWESKLRRLLTHPLFVRVAGPLLAAAIIGLVPAVRKGAAQAATWTWDLLAERVEIPLGLLVLLVVAALVWPGMSARRWWTSRGLAEPSEPEWKRYTEDRFSGVHWRWLYLGSGHVTGLTPFCLRDDTEIVAIGSRFSPDVTLKCETCGWERHLPEGYDLLEGQIERRIRRKLRTGEFVDALRERDAEPLE